MATLARVDLLLLPEAFSSRFYPPDKSKREGFLFSLLSSG
jgi:hypothetical protein